MTTSKNGRASFSSSAGALLAIPYSRTQGESQNFDLTTTSQDTAAYTVADPPHITIQLRSSEWLQRYGLKSQKLTFDQILQQIGFKRAENYDPSIGKTVGAKYAGNLYQEIQQDNGDRYVLTCRPEKLREYRNRLVRMLNVLQKRLTFLTSGSRRAFGVIGDPSVCFVCDCKTTDHKIFNQYQLALRSLFKEQISKIKRFNIIWVSNEIEQFQDKPIDVSSTSIDQAIDWICNRKYARNKISISSTCEAVLKAFNSPVHGIYLISEGNSSDSAREVLRDNIVKTRLSSSTPIPIHVVSLFCQNNDTEVFLRSIAQTADGSYFSYKIKNEIIDLKAPSNLTDPTRIKLQEDKLEFGTNALLPKFEHPTDITLMYKEIAQCQNTIDRFEKILGFVRDEKENSVQTNNTTKSLDTSNKSNQINENMTNNLQRSLVIQSSALFNYDENDMASIDWLKIYGIDAQKLDFHAAVQPAAFKHCDGVVTLFKAPESNNGKNNNTPANPRDKLINAKYCDQFAHVTWPDGTIRHVYVTPEFHRDYERRMRALLEKVKARLLWLKKGSRDVFGTILEKNIYILIDTSKSMQNHLSFVKDKLRLLLQDQLFGKERINMVSFNTIINPWRDRLTKVNDTLTQTQLQPWIDSLNAEGSTNTLSAIRFALADSATEGIYLLTDGRPDQNERHILSQVQYRQTIPIHTIAFNCQDQTANQFLFDLSKQTGGRFHAFNYGLDNISIDVPESEDISHLKEEIIRGEKDLQRVADLRDECTGRSWSQDNAQTKYQSPYSNELPASLLVRRHSTVETAVRPTTPSMPQRIDRKKRSSKSLNRRSKSKTVTKSYEQTDTFKINPDQWLLPETEVYLKTSEQKHEHLPDIHTEEQTDDEAVSKEYIKRTPTPYGEVKSYLKKNSLVAKGLTIFDVLYPTSVTVKEPQHVQVIDRYVLSKVWDDILPLAYGSYTNKLRLVNHYAVDLEKYEQKLKDLIKEYYQFTSQFIWKWIPDEDKRTLGPHIYWTCLSKEDQDKYAQEITSGEQTDPSALESFAWRKLSTDEQNKLLQKPVVYHEKTESLLKTTLANSQSALEGVSRMDVEIKRGIKFLQISTDLRKYQRRAPTESKQKPDQTLTTKPKTLVHRSLGQRVLCRYDGDGYFYQGIIQKTSDNRTIILFDMEIEQEPSGHILLPITNSNFQLSLFMDDCVLVRQMRDYEEYWAPGLILCLPSPFIIPANMYTVRVFDPLGRKVYVHRQDIVRITVAFFQRSVLHLQNIHRKSITGGRIILEAERTPPSSPRSSSSDDLKALLHQFIDPLTKKIEHLNKAYEKRFNELQTALEDQIGAIRILQERSTKKPVRDEGTGPIRIPTPPTPPPIRLRTPPIQVTTSPIQTPTPPPKPSTLVPGTTVYAVWFDDDGLVYKSTIIKSLGSDNYTVERIDLPGIQTELSRDKIFLDSSHTPLRNLNSNSFALIKYPNDSRPYLCPAVILRHRTSEPKTKVRFHDCHEEDIEYYQTVIPITEEQFEVYVQNRIKKEKSLCNQVTVGLNKHTNTFMLGTITKRIGNGHEYVIKWCDESESEQKEEHLFGAFTRRDVYMPNSYVLAIDNDDKLYKPAKVKSILNDGQKLYVEYTELNREQMNSKPKTAEVLSTTTFVITKEYHDEIIGILQK